LIISGENDDWCPARPCQTLVETAALEGHRDVSIVVYPGATHSFDTTFRGRAGGNRGSVIEIVGAPDSSIAADRKAGFEEVIGKSNVKILASLAGNSSRYRAQALVQEAIGSSPGFDAIFATNDAMIIGAIDALASVNIDPASKVTVGVDAIPEAIQLVKEGKLTATMDQSASKQARQAVEVLIGYILNRTQPPQKVILIKPELLTKTSLPGG
jgi:inositol transport system substrate-binding protein